MVRTAVNRTGSGTFVPFVLLGHARSGSTAIQLALSKHPHVRMFGELFNEGEAGRERAAQARGARVRPFRPGEDGRLFLTESIFKAPRFFRARNVAAIGFKLFYYHARQPNESSLWEYLAGNELAHIVHLMRPNLLDVWISLQIAHMTNQWTTLHSSPARRAVPPFHGAPEEIAGYFEWINAQMLEARRIFARHPVLELDYENDVRFGLDGTMSRLQTFLKLTPLPLFCPTVRQSHASASRQLTNYDELRSFFRGTRFEVFFVE